MKALNLGVRFALELGMLASLCYWGFRTGEPLPLDLLLGVGAPLTAATIWGVFVSPKARFDLPRPVRLMIEFDLFALAAVALYVSGAETLAVIFGLTALVSGTLNHLWRQPKPSRPPTGSPTDGRTLGSYKLFSA